VAERASRDEPQRWDGSRHERGRGRTSNHRVLRAGDPLAIHGVEDLDSIADLEGLLADDAGDVLLDRPWRQFTKSSSFSLAFGRHTTSPCQASQALAATDHALYPDCT